MRSKLILHGLGTVLWSTSTVLALTPYGNGTPPPAPLPSACDSTAPQPSPADGNSTTATNVDYEYIVVGSGPGGGPLAARLAIAGFKVLLIEAGDDQGETLQEKTPLLWLLASEYDPMKWSYFVNHYPTLEQQQQDSKFTWETPAGDYYHGPSPPNGSKPLGVLYPRAGTLGGCAAHNALKTVLPHDSDWANIASLTNDSSWEPHHMKKYFEKLEDNQYILPGASTRGHGKKGWLGTSLMDLSFMAADNKLTSAVSAAVNAFGVKGISKVLNTVPALKTVFVKDVNGPHQQVNNEGIYQQPLAVSNGFRSGPRNFLIDTASAVNADGSRKYHLDIRLNTFVTSVQFDKTGDTPRAIGVNFLDGRGLYRATPKSVLGSPSGTGSINASREVIISAGAYNTPQLLKLSGVGPKEELASFNIPLVLDAPGVGSNLQDRYETAVITKSPSPYELLHGCSLMNTNPDECLIEWQNGTTIQERGVYTTNGFAFAMIRKSSVAEENPDLYLYGAPVSFSGFFPGYTTLPYLLPNASTTGWFSWVVLKAHARNNAGTVTLRSSDPLDTPIINFNTFETGTQGSDNSTGSAWQKDLQAFYEGVQFARSVNKELQAIEPNCFEEVFPGEAVQEEQDVKDFIKKESFGHHASCSCPIGADGDKMAVLDGKFRVRGTEGLRVVDASVFPKIPGFFPSLPTYMVSEKAADVIIQDAAAATKST